MPGALVIGLLGGMSWPSTISYYRALNEGAQAKLGGSHSARVLLWSEDYHEVERLQLARRWDDAGRLLAAGARRLEAGGAELIGIACNTMHLVADAVRTTTDLPVVDIVETTVAAVTARGARRAAVLGTAFTIGSALFATALEKAGVEAIAPAGADLRELDRIIYEELCVGRGGTSTRDRLTGIGERLVAAGADTLVLACTELGEAMADVPGATTVDTCKAHVTALLDASIGG